MEETAQKLRKMSEDLGLWDLGFFKDEQAPGDLHYGISLIARLSDAVVQEICDAPTHSYFHHYRTVNAWLDQCMLQLGMLLQREGWRYLPIPASQSVPTPSDPNGYHGRYSHKEGACRAGLGTMGKSGLFLHRQWGPRVRIGTVFTDCPLPVPTAQFPPSVCGDCQACVAACPAQAIRGETWRPDIPEFSLVDPRACSRYMKEHFGHIGRGAVCGICMRVCPKGKTP